MKLGKNKKHFISQILLSHRAAYSNYADQIVVLEKGKIIQVGNDEKKGN